MCLLPQAPSTPSPPLKKSYWEDSLRFYASRSERLKKGKSKEAGGEMGFLDFLFPSEKDEEGEEKKGKDVFFEERRSGVCVECSKYFSSSCAQCHRFYSPLFPSSQSLESLGNVRSRVQQLVGKGENETKEKKGNETKEEEEIGFSSTQVEGGGWKIVKKERKEGESEKERLMISKERYIS